MRCFGRVEYDGTAYAGWQIQSNNISIQSELESAFFKIVRKPCKVVGAGRTDAGVHARGQGMHTELPDTIDLKQCEKSLNAVLPRDIALYDLCQVDDSFHARFSATARCYKYYIITRKMPLRQNRALLLSYPVNWQKVREQVSFLSGRHDFTAFCASGSSTDNKICTITKASLEEKDTEYIFTIQADRFIYKMVRSIVGTLIDIGRGRITDSLETVINSKDRNLVGDTASPHGLVLESVTYPGVLNDVQK